MNGSTVRAAQPAPAGMTAARKRRVMVVDDDEALAAMFGATLDLLGFETTLAPDADLALIQASALKPALVVTDIQMPFFGSGADLLRDVRALPGLAAVPFVFVTGIEPSRARALVPLGDRTIRLLFKPVPPSMLEQAVLELLAGR